MLHWGLPLNKKMNRQEVNHNGLLTINGNMAGTLSPLQNDEGPGKFKKNTNGEGIEHFSLGFTFLVGG